MLHCPRLLQNLKRLLLQNNCIKDGALLDEDSNREVPGLSSGLVLENKMNGPNDSIPVMPNFGGKLSLNKLEVLHLDSNSITNIMCLNLQQYFPNLKLLSLKSNAITKVHWKYLVEAMEFSFIKNKNVFIAWMYLC